MWRRTLHRLHRTPVYRKIPESYHDTNLWIRAESCHHIIYRNWRILQRSRVSVAGVPNVKMDFVQTVKNTTVHWKVPRIISQHQHLNTGRCHHISEMRESYNDHGCSCCRCSEYEEWLCIDCTEHHSVSKDTRIISRYQHLKTGSCHHISEIREFCNEQRIRVSMLQMFRIWRMILYRLYRTPQCIKRYQNHIMAPTS
jgi:hypothetical protein